GFAWTALSTGASALKKNNADSVSDNGYATVYSRNKARDSVQANLDVNTANISLKKDNVDSISNTGYATVYSRNKARDSMQANVDANSAVILIKKDNSDSTDLTTGYTTLYQNSLKESPLSFTAGLTRAGNDVRSDLFTGVSGGQTLIGSTSSNSGMTYIATSGAGVTGADHIFKVGNNGAVEAMRIVSDSLGYVGIGTDSPTTVLHVKKNLPAPGHNTVLKIENAYGAGNFGFNSAGAYWANSAVYNGNGGGFNIFSYQQTGFFGIQTNGNVGIGTSTPSAYLEVKAGSSTHVPFRLNSGALASTTLAGGIEFFNDNFYGTIKTSNTRKTFAFLESPTFTGTVGGITKSMVGLGNVDNTSDINKPVSTTTQTALDAKWGTGGNTGTNDAASFIGTTDNVPLNLKVNNQNAGRIDNTLSNSFWGYQAGNIAATGTGNTAIGANSLATNNTGNSNTALGSGANVSADGLDNATAIGSGAIVDASNKVRIGNAFVSVIEGEVAYSLPSDARFKYNILANVPGLDFIKKLTPVTYYFDEEKLNEFTRTGLLNNSVGSHAAYYPQKQLHTGFLAQDVEKVAIQLGYNFDGVHAPVNKKDHYSLAYSQFIMPLVKAVQEQQLIIEDQDKKLNTQAEQIKKMNERIEELAKVVEQLTKK
ncbi:MAG: tail fiber domain-containing protein, partial [Ginsengibacter sp.]